MRVIKAIARRVIPTKNRLKQSLNTLILNDVFAIHFCALGPGFFAHLNWCLEILLHCDQRGLKPYFMVSTPYMIQRAGENWFDYFFYLKLPVSEPHPFTVYYVRDISELAFAKNLNSLLHFGNAPQLFHKYIGIKSHIVDKCDSFYNQHMAGRTTLGVHYRGSDKMSATGEGPYAAYNVVQQIVRKYLSEHPQIDCVFVASDEKDFSNYMRTTLDSIHVVWTQQTQFANGDLPAFRTDLIGGDPYLKSEEALIDCLLLSRCDALVKTASILSGWSKVFNPQLPVVMATRPKDNVMWFPERAIFDEQQPAIGE